MCYTWTFLLELKLLKPISFDLSLSSTINIKLELKFNFYLYIFYPKKNLYILLLYISSSHQNSIIEDWSQLDCLMSQFRFGQQRIQIEFWSSSSWATCSFTPLVMFLVIFISMIAWWPNEILGPILCLKWVSFNLF